jgi:hypothetical protein
VEITLDRCTHVEPALDQRLLLLTQLLQVLGNLPLHGLSDHRRSFGPNPRDLRPRALLLMFATLFITEL